MQNAYLEKFEEWWAKTTFESTRGWSRDVERKFLPASPRKLARTAWNAAFHLMLRQVNERAREATEFANKRVLAMQRRLEQAQCEIVALEYKVPMTASEFETRLLDAKDALASAEVQAQNLRESLRNAVHAAQAADKKVSVTKAALRSALDAYDEATRSEHISPKSALAFECRIRAIVEVP